MADQNDWDFVDPRGDVESLPKTSLFGDARKGDSFTMSVLGDAEVVERDHGKAVTFPVTIDNLDGLYAETWEGDEVEEGADYSFETASNRFLSELQGHRPLSGKTFDVEISGTGYDAAYIVNEVGEK